MAETKEYLDKEGLAHYTAGMKALIDDAEPDSITEESIDEIVDAAFDGEEDVEEEVDNLVTNLPPVTADDNGKILQVVDGAWTVVKAELGGGTEPEADTEVVVLAEASYTGFEEIEEGAGIYVLPLEIVALKAGETYRVVWGSQEFTLECGLLQEIPWVGNLGIAGLGDDTGEPFLLVSQGETVVFTADPGDSHYIGIYQKAPPAKLPGVTAADEGKMLQVVNGVWTAVDDTQRVTDIVNTVLEDALNGEY